MLMVNQLSGFGVSGDLCVPGVILTHTHDTDGGGNQNRSLRIIMQSSALSCGGEDVRVEFTSHTSSALGVDNAGIGVLAIGGNAWDTVDTPQELLFSAASGFLITSGGTIKSDWLTLTSKLLSTQGLVVILDVDGSDGSFRFDSGSPSGLSGAFKEATDSYNVAAPTGFSGHPFHSIIEVETRLTP